MRDGISPATREHGAKVVADPQVPMTLWDVCPVAGDNWSTGVTVVLPPNVQVSQFTPNDPLQVVLVTVPVPEAPPFMAIQDVPVEKHHTLVAPPPTVHSETLLPLMILAAHPVLATVGVGN